MGGMRPVRRRAVVRRAPSGGGAAADMAMRLLRLPEPPTAVFAVPKRTPP
jgi:hypothetical protein